MRALGIILAGGNNNRMRELSNRRAIAAMPVAGSYRSIDFALSNMANSHIAKVAVLTQYNARSLNEHLSSSKWWDFGRKQGGLFVFTPTITPDNSFWYQGTADAIYQNLDFLKRSHEPYVVIASGDCVYKLDYNKVLEYHIAKRADVTIVCKDVDANEDVTRFGVLRMNEDYRIEEFEEKPMVSDYHTISTGIYVIRRLLQDRVDYWNNIPTVEAYYKTNMGFPGSRDVSFHQYPISIPRSTICHRQNTIRMSGKEQPGISGCIINGQVGILFCLRKYMKQLCHQEFGLF